MTPAGALAGVRILDLCDAKGAFAGKLLAGLGADVVLVEPPGGSVLRTVPPFWRGEPGPERSLFFAFYGAGKRSLTLDAAREPEHLARLAASADVLLASDALEWIDVDALRAAHPRLVVASITPFGRSGPYRDWKSSDTVAQATGGMLYVNGHADGPPLRSLGCQAYHQAGIFAAIGVVAALIARATSGRGQHVDVSLQAAVAGALEHVPGFWHQAGLVNRRQGTLHWTRYFRVGRCRDGWVMHCTLGDWTSLLEWMKADGMGTDVDDPALEDIRTRQAAADRLFDALDAWAERYTVEELVEGAQLRRIPYAAVRPPEALLHDPHLTAREFFVPIHHPEIGATIRHPGAPFRLTDAPWRVGAPPGLGEHDVTVRASGGDPWAGGEARRAPLSAPQADRRETGARGARSEAQRGSSPAHAHPSGTLRPLDGIRVTDFTWVVAGPVTTRILADLGAEVIKIERRGSLDFGDRRGGLSGTLMRGKKSLVVDLNDARGLAVARRLAALSDVVVDNFSARVMTNLGLDYDALVKLRPDVICVRMTGFGLTGPARDHVSYGPTLQASTGYTLLMAEPDGPPAGFGYSYSDLAGGNLGALAVLAALRHRQETGRGQLVDLAQLEAVASVIGPTLLDRAAHGGASAATGNASQEAPAAPHGVYRTAGDDRWIAITVFTDPEWQGFAAAIGRPAWTDDARFATAAGRLRHAGELDRLVAAWAQSERGEDAVARLQRAGVPAGLVANAEDLCRLDPQLEARGHFVDVPTPEGRMVRLDGPPFLLSDTPARPSGPGPLLGEHTDEVLSTLLGYGAEEIAALRAANVIG
ncbi:MAG TPA: CoA transferase [Candidatus Binatia bacterium]|nr:CoA transferase [Candidatus Binatia bacterium]